MAGGRVSQAPQTPTALLGEADLRRIQLLLADTLCWFDGFAAAHAHRDPWDRPDIPDRGALRKANGLLQDALNPTPETPIPF